MRVTSTQVEKYFSQRNFALTPIDMGKYLIPINSLSVRSKQCTFLERARFARADP